MKNKGIETKNLEIFEAYLAFRLGFYMGKGLLTKDYPDNFNLLISDLSKELYAKVLGLEEVKPIEK